MTKFNVMNLQDVTTESHFCQTQAYNSTTHLHIWYVLSAYLQLYQLSVIKIHNQLGLRWRWPYAYRPYTVGLYTICRQILSIKMKPNVTVVVTAADVHQNCVSCPSRRVVCYLRDSLSGLQYSVVRHSIRRRLHGALSIEI